MAKLKLFNRFAKLKGKCNALMSSSFKQRTDYDDLNSHCNNKISNKFNDENEEFNKLNEKLLMLNGSDKNTLSFDDYICTCCFEILYNPITLLCGHNICQLCLANWFLISSKRICPTCRQEWIGSPKANIVLKNTIENLFPKQMKKRKMNFDDKSIRETQENFEKKCKLVNYTINDDVIGTTGMNNQQNDNNNNRQQNGFFNNFRNQNRLVKYTIISFLSGLLIGITISASILLGFFFIWYLNNTYTIHSTVNKYSKSTELWNEKETYEWLQQLGPWSSAKITPIANKLRLNGTGLLELTESQLMNEPFNITDEFYLNLLLNSIKGLRYDTKIRLPSFLEFKNSNRFKVIFTTLIFDSFPRLTLLGIFNFDYNLFIKIKNIIEYGYTNYNNTDITTQNTIVSSSTFMFYAAQFPHIYLNRLINECFSETNPYTVLIITLNCYLLTIIEICRKYYFIKAILHRKFLMYVKKSLSTYIKEFSIYLSLIILWFVLPTIIYDCIFVYYIYFKIFFNSFILFRFLKRFSYLIMLNYF